MKLWLKVTMGVIFGFGGGFATGFFFHKKLNDVQFVEIEQEEMELLEKETEKKQKEASNVINSVQELPSDPDKMRITLQGKISYVEADREAKEKYANIWGAYKRYSDETNANELPVPLDGDHDGDEPSPTSDVEEGFDEEFLEMIEQEQVEPGQVAPPHPITLGEFYNERSEYDKITIDWYESDNVFVDENEEIIADLKTYIGQIDIHKLFGETGADEDPDIRFVRNEQYGTDYEIIKHHRSWIETTGGSE